MHLQIYKMEIFDHFAESVKFKHRDHIYSNGLKNSD